MENFDYSINQAADFFGVNRGTIYDWIKKGCPKTSPGRVNLKDVFQWWFENIGIDRAVASATDDSLTEAKRKFWWLRAESEEIRLEKEKGTLLSVTEAEKAWAWRMSEYKSGCENLSSALPPLLEGKAISEMRQIIDNYVWSMFDSVCRTGHFCPAPKKRTTGRPPGSKTKKKAAKKKRRK